MRATEGFVFQGISNIEDKVDFVLNDLCIRVPGSQIPDLQGKQSSLPCFDSRAHVSS